MIQLSLAARNLLSWRFLFVLVVALTPCAAWAQFIPGLSNAGAAPGVSLEPDGTLKRRQLDEKSEMTTMRARAKATLEVAKNEKLTCVSLPRAFAAARKAIDAGKPIPDDIKYLGGLTQIKFVFVYEEEKDLMIAGPAEPVHVIDELNAIGTRTGRPVMRLEDFVVAMQVVRGLGGGAFGSGLGDGRNHTDAGYVVDTVKFVVVIAGSRGGQDVVHLVVAELLFCRRDTEVVKLLVLSQCRGDHRATVQ